MAQDRGKRLNLVKNNSIFGFHKMRVISRVAEELVCDHEGLYSVVSVSNES